MDTLIFFAVPVFLVSIALEQLLARDRDIYERRDTWTSIKMSIGAALVGLPFRLAFLWVLGLVYQYRLFTIEPSWLGFVLLLFAEDLCYYWSHRTNHEVGNAEGVLGGDLDGFIRAELLRKSGSG